MDRFSMRRNFARAAQYVALCAAIFGVGYSSASGAEGKPKESPKTRKTQRLYLLNNDGSLDRPFTKLPDVAFQRYPSISAEGNKVFFEGSPKLNQALASVYVTSLDGEAPRKLIDGNHPSGSPEGNRFAVLRHGENRGVWVVSATDPDDCVLLDENGNFPIWSPEGSRLAYTHWSDNGFANVTVVDLVEGTRRELYNEQFPCPYNYLGAEMAWSPDGKTLLFHAFLPNTNGLSELVMVSAEGAETLHKTVLGGRQQGLAWTPNGEAIMSSRFDPLSKKHQLWTLAAKGQKNVAKLLPAQDRTVGHQEVAILPGSDKILCSIVKKEPVATK